MSQERKFYVDGKIYSLFEYGYTRLMDFHKETGGESVNPDDMSRQDIEEWALETLEDAMKHEENEDIYEIK